MTPLDKLTMDNGDTVRRLATITDEGVFERLATAVLRKADPRYALVSHPGVNAEGKTVKSPMDGVAFLPDADPPHMIVIHHTITVAKDLDGKWLHDPATVKARAKGGKPTEPPGDVIKTAAIVADERVRTPNLKATLVLTTNHDPGHAIVRDVHAAAAAAGLIIDIWPRSRIADFLDNDPDGQWLRRQFLGIEQERISENLLRELAKKSLEAAAPPDDANAWVERELDRALAARDEGVLFVIADSGGGKSVACYKRLRDNLDEGAFSLVLSDDDVAGSATLDHALEKALLRLHPALAAGCGSAALQLGTAAQRLVITVEDINRSGRGATLIGQIARWSEGRTAGANGWQILCPVWPQVLSSLSDDARKRISANAVFAQALSKEEGTRAIQRRRSCQGRTISQFDAAAISEALGRDPLLIALHDPDAAPTPDGTIGQFVESSLQRLSATRQEYSAAEYRKALRSVAKNMLLRRELDPEWLTVLGWPELSSDFAALRHLVHHGEIIRSSGPSSGEKLAFRHDRVREWLLADGFSELLNSGQPVDDIVSEPFFAEVIGFGLARGVVAKGGITSIVDANPLAGFFALRHVHLPVQSPQQDVIECVVDWLEKNKVDGPARRSLQWESARMLAECEGPHILEIAAKLGDQSWHGLRARFRNGDLMGGIALCQRFELGTRVAGLEEFVDHVKQRYGRSLIDALANFLHRPTLSPWERSGALRLAGHLAEPRLAEALKACWDGDPDRETCVSEYLWAFAQCAAVGADAEAQLKAVCDLWASLPDTAAQEHMSSPRFRVVEFGVKWAFQRKIPEAAIPYLTERAKSDDLKWPITYLFEGIDQPDAIEFVVRELARRDEELEQAGKFWPFSSRSAEDFKRTQEETGRTMSERTRSRLVPLWQNEGGNKYLRKQALRFWSATKNEGDLERLRTVTQDDTLFGQAMWERVRRRDQTAIPGLLQKLRTDRNGYWWQLGREFWTDELTDALDAALSQRATPASPPADADKEKEGTPDWILSEMIMNLPATQAESILLRHWTRLQDSDCYVGAALYFASPALLAAVADAVKRSATPQQLFRYLTMRVGRTRGTGGKQNGWYRIQQIEGLLPYLDYLSESDVHQLWDTCNKQGWVSWRRQYLDGRLSEELRNRWYLSDAKAIEALNELLGQAFPWVDHWVDRCLETGRSVDHVFDLAARWCVEKKTTQALGLLASALMHAGARRHLPLMNIDGIVPQEEAEAIRMNAAYAVRRRTLV